MESTDHLKELYEDKDGFRKEETVEISGPNDFTEFYNRLKNIKEFHRKHPNQVSISVFSKCTKKITYGDIFQVSVPMSVEFDELNKLRENPTEEMSSKYYFVLSYIA